MESTENNRIKYHDATCLNRYLQLLSRKQRVRFATAVCLAYDCHRKTFFNWKYMCCRIPEDAKEVIEDISGCHIFTIRDTNV